MFNTRAKTAADRSGYGTVGRVYIKDPDAYGLGSVVHEPLRFCYQETLN